MPREGLLQLTTSKVQPSSTGMPIGRLLQLLAGTKLTHIHRYTARTKQPNSLRTPEQCSDKQIGPGSQVNWSRASASTV